MPNTFSFKSSEDLFLYINDDLSMRFIGDACSPYTHLPLTFWMLEKQFTGNDCFKGYISKCDDKLIKDVRSEYKDRFYCLNRYIIPEMMRLPVASEREFNDILSKTGLSYLAEMNSEGTEIRLEKGQGIIVRDAFGPKPYEMRRITLDDICLINKAFKKCIIDMSNMKPNVPCGIYECIVMDVNAASSKQETI